VIVQATTHQRAPSFHMALGRGSAMPDKDVFDQYLQELRKTADMGAPFN